MATSKTWRLSLATIALCAGSSLGAGCGPIEETPSEDGVSIEERHVVSGIGYRVWTRDFTIPSIGYISVGLGNPPGEKVTGVGWEVIDANGVVIPGFAATKLSLSGGASLTVQPRGCNISKGCQAFPGARLRLYLIYATNLASYSSPSVLSPFLNTEAATYTVTCPPGTVALSGGWDVQDTNDLGLHTEPVAVFFKAGNPAGISVTGKRPLSGSPWRIMASAACAVPPPGYQLRSWSGVPGVGVVLCSGNRRILGAASPTYGFDSWHPTTTTEGTSGWSYVSSTPSVPTSIEATCIY